MRIFSIVSSVFMLVGTIAVCVIILVGNFLQETSVTVDEVGVDGYLLSVVETLLALEVHSCAPGMHSSIASFKAAIHVHVIP